MNILEQTETIFSIITAIIGIIIPVSNFFKSKFAKKGIRKKEKSDLDKYSIFFIKIMLIGLLVAPIWLAVLFGIQLLLSGIFGFVLEIEWSLALFSIFCFIAILLESIKNRTKTITPKTEKYKKLKKILFYDAIYFCSVWMWSLSFIVKCKIINAIVVFIVLVCEFASVFVFDDTKTYQYEYASLIFKNSKSLTCLTEDIYQEEEWIIVFDRKTGRETKYLKVDLEKIEFYNKSN